MDIYIEGLRKEGGLINSEICIAAARGILDALKPFLPEFGGMLVLDNPWTQSFLHRNGLVNRKGTKAAQKILDNSECTKTAFSEGTALKCKQLHNPDELVLN